MIVTLNGVCFNVDYDYQPKEPESLNYPGCQAEVTLNSIYVCGSNVDIQQFMSGYWIGRIEEQIMEQQFWAKKILKKNVSGLSPWVLSRLNLSLMPSGQNIYLTGL